MLKNVAALPEPGAENTDVSTVGRQVNPSADEEGGEV